jgi:hypothetical protein
MFHNLFSPTHKDLKKVDTNFQNKLLEIDERIKKLEMNNIEIKEIKIKIKNMEYKFSKYYNYLIIYNIVLFLMYFLIILLQYKYILI